jgi:hypothetical protein
VLALRSVRASTGETRVRSREGIAAVRAMVWAAEAASTVVEVSTIW